jgi:hypothetical protein
MKRRRVPKGPDGGRRGEGSNNVEETNRSRATEAAAAAAIGSEQTHCQIASDSASSQRGRASAAAMALNASTTTTASSTAALPPSQEENDKEQEPPTPLALQPTTTEPTIVANVTENDVLLGRGATIINHVGNQRFHELVLARKQEYHCTLRHQIKDAIARKIFVFISEQRNGRFLRRIDSVYEAQSLGVPHDWTTMWLVADPNVAMEKIKQALRGKRAAKRARDALRDNNPGDGQAAPPAQQQQQPGPQHPNVNVNACHQYHCRFFGRRRGLGDFAHVACRSLGYASRTLQFPLLDTHHEHLDQQCSSSKSLQLFAVSASAATAATATTTVAASVLHGIARTAAHTTDHHDQLCRGASILWSRRLRRRLRRATVAT